MKFAAYLALVGSASAITLHKAPVSHSWAHKKAPVMKTLMQVKELPEWKEVEEWVKAEFKKDGAITVSEVHDALSAWEKETGKTISDNEWQMVESSFAYADLNNDMQVTEAEMHCVMTGEGCPEHDDGVLQAHELTEEQGKWLEKAIEAEF